MKKILIVSDTHRKDLNLKYVIDKVSPIDMLIHLGDIEGSEDKIRSWVECPTSIISGNNDFFSMLDKEKELLIDGKRALITHGHIYGVSLGVEQLRKEAIARGFDIAMFGHTHKPYLEIGDKVTILNPGSISYPRQSGNKPSYIIMEINNVGEFHYTINYLETDEV
jgi:phosphoesterase, MJ0936 family